MTARQRDRMWTVLSLLGLAGAILAVLGWIVTAAPELALLAVLLLFVCLGALYAGGDSLADDLGSVDPHPLDPYPEELRQRAEEARRHRLAMGGLRRRASERDDEPEERGP